jgi:regulator of sirC expression with transglutaminase-like and TPR domain
MFDELGFGGNLDDYYDPRNSLLNEVLDRRVGIPITLAVLMIELGRRLDVGLSGVGMPGHFLVRELAHGDVFFDPFHDGHSLSAADCRALFFRLHGAQTAFSERYLAPVGPSEILRRMLNNLRQIYVSRSDHAALVWVLELTAQFPTAGFTEFRELASVQSARGAYDRAAASFDTAATLAEAAGQSAAEDRSMSALLRARLN